MKVFKRFLVKYWPFLLLFSIITFIYKEALFQSKILLPVDTLVGAYFPWLDYKWGYSVGVPVKNPLLSDAFSHFYIFKTLTVKLFQSGVWPLWNRYVLAGIPLLASFHVSTLFPANALLFISPTYGWTLYIFFSSILASFSMMLFLKRYIKSPISRIIASLVFAFAGPMTTWAEFGTATYSASFIPLILYSVDQIIFNNRRRFYPLISIIVTLFIFAGHVQLLTYSVLIFPIYILFQLKKKKISLIQLFNFAPFFLLGIGLASIQLLPTIKLFSHSIRSEENYASGFNYGLVSLPQLIRLWVPDFFGHPSTYNQWGKYIYHEYSGFLGTLSIPLIFTLFKKKLKLKPVGKFALLLFIISLVFVVYHPLSAALFSLPIPLLTYSSASRLFFVTGFAASILLAFSLDTFNKMIDAKRLILYSFLFLTINIIALVFVPKEYLHVAIRNSILPSALLLSICLLMYIKTSKNILLVILLFLFSFDLGRYFLKYNPIVPSHLTFPTTPVIDFLVSQPKPFRIARDNTNLFPPNSWANYGLESVEGYEPLRPLEYSRLFHRLENEPFLNRSSRYSILQDVNPIYLDALNVKYFIAADANEEASPSANLQKIVKSGYQLVFNDKSTTIYENPNFISRAYFVNEIIPVNNEKQLSDTINSLNFDPRTQAILYNTSFNISSHPDNKIEIIDYQPQSMTLNIKAQEDSFLVISDSFDDGWQATLNSNSTNIYLTNGALIGIFIPKGNHLLKLVYFPQDFALGIKISLFSLLIIISSIFFLKNKKNE